MFRNGREWKQKGFNPLRLNLNRHLTIPCASKFCICRPLIKSKFQEKAPHKNTLSIHLGPCLTQYEHYGIYNIREHGQLFGYELNVKACISGTLTWFTFEQTFARTARYFWDADWWYWKMVWLSTGIATFGVCLHVLALYVQPQDRLNTEPCLICGIQELITAHLQQNLPLWHPFAPY